MSRNFFLTFLAALLHFTAARPVVRSIRSTHEFDRLLTKHATETGLPVVVDFYSDGCGPCRMMKPIYKKVAADYVDKAVFVTVDTNVQYELSSRYQIRSLPTFQWFIGGKKSDEAKGGIGEGPLRQMTDKAIRQAEIENVQVELEQLISYFSDVNPEKSQADVESVYNKCVEMNRKASRCQGIAANNLIRKLRKKYKKIPKTTPLFSAEAKKSKEGPETKPSQKNQSKDKPGTGPNLHLATKEQLRDELEKRLDEERDAQVESETEEEEEEALEDHYGWVPSPFPERVTIIGGGPAGLAAAVYAARAGLTPLVIAPSMGGQLQGKGVDVENYPGLHNVTGPAVVSAMRKQASFFGSTFLDDLVVRVDASQRPLRVFTNSTGAIETHSIVVATGADSKWLGIEGEYDLRGGGVSSCATCDGFLYSGKRVLVVGGGEAACEDAFMMSRLSKVTLVHRRDKLRASKILADRILDNPNINIMWNTVVDKIVGKAVEQGDGEDVDLDNMAKVVTGAVLRNVESQEVQEVDCDAVFIAIGHTPNTSFLRGVVDFDPKHDGYLQTYGQSTETSVPGIFAAGDVSDAIYRQAITSAGSGAAAALDAERWLSKEGLGNEAAEFEAELMAEIMDNSSEHAETGTGYNAYEDAGGRMNGMKESISSEL